MQTYAHACVHTHANTHTHVHAHSLLCTHAHAHKMQIQAGSLWVSHKYTISSVYHPCVQTRVEQPVSELPEETVLSNRQNQDLKRWVQRGRT